MLEDGCRLVGDEVRGAETVGLEEVDLLRRRQRIGRDLRGDAEVVGENVFGGDGAVADREPAVDVGGLAVGPRFLWVRVPTDYRYFGAMDNGYPSPRYRINWW